MSIWDRISFKAVLVVSFWGVSFVATRIALEALTPAALVASRMLIGSAAMLILARLLGRGVWPAAGDRRRCALLGLILASHLLIQAFGLLRTSAINTGWIIAFTPVVIAVGAWLFLGEQLGARAWAGLALGTAGVASISLSSGLDFSGAKVGDLLQLASCLTWTAYTLLAVSVIKRSGSLRVTVSAVTVAAIASAIAALGSNWTVGEVTLKTAVAVGFLGLVCSGLAHWLWYAAVRDVGSTRSGAYLYLEPFVTWFAATSALGETVSMLGVAGGLAVLVGVWLVSSTRQQQA